MSADTTDLVSADPDDSIPPAPYHPAPTRQDWGSLQGTVEFEGDPPVDAVVHPVADADVCGDSLTVGTVTNDGRRLGDVVVWLRGVANGKALPQTRRYELMSERCLLTPRAQAVVVGGTLNVRNRDQATHRFRFYRAGSSAVVAQVVEMDDGQVVPVDRALTRPGRLLVRCATHPFTTAWLLVFNHPYFASTDRHGTFSMDSIPPGRYAIEAWHERFGAIMDTVEVKPGGKARIGLVFGAAGQKGSRSVGQ